MGEKQKSLNNSPRGETSLWSFIRQRISFTDGRPTEWESEDEKASCYLTVYDVLSNNLGTNGQFEVELWWHRALKVLWVLLLSIYFVNPACYATTDKPVVGGCWVDDVQQPVNSSGAKANSLWEDCGCYRSLGDRCPVLFQCWHKH